MNGEHGGTAAPKRHVVIGPMKELDTIAANEAREARRPPMTPKETDPDAFEFQI